MKRIHAVLAFTLLAATFALFAAEEPPPQVVVTTAGGEQLRGPLRELKADWSLRVGEKTLTPNEVVSIRRANASLPPFPVDDHIILANGDRIPVNEKSARLVGEKLVFVNPDLNDGKEISMPLATVAVLWRMAPDNVEQADLLRRQLLNATRPRDRVLLRNGDALEGLFTELDAKHVTVEVDRKPIEVTIDKFAALALSTDGQDKLKPKGMYARLILSGDSHSNGTRLSLASATCDGVTLQGTTTYGVKVSVPLTQVAALDLLQGAAVYLSELKPAKFEQTPYLGDGVKWPLANDAAVTGRDLRLAGSVYERGLGMHSRSLATYTLDGKYRRFEALVGLDDETGREGTARIRVLGDGKPLLDGGKDSDVTAKSGPVVVNVSVAGVKELTLEVDFGARGDVQGHVNWADARLLK